MSANLYIESACSITESVNGCPHKTSGKRKSAPGGLLQNNRGRGKKMQKKIKGIIFIVVSIALITCAKVLEVPALISVLLVLAALALFIYALPAFISRAESSGEKQVASSDKH